MYGFSFHPGHLRHLFLIKSKKNNGILMRIYGNWYQLIKKKMQQHVKVYIINLMQINEKPAATSVL